MSRSSSALRIAAALALACVLTVALGWVLFETRVEHLTYKVDWPIRRWFHAHRYEPYVDPTRSLSAFGSFEAVNLTTAGFVLIALALRRWRAAALFAVAVAGGNLVAAVGKVLVPRDRRITIGSIGGLDVQGYSFPSGHASRTVALAMALAVVALAWPRLARWTVWCAAGLFAAAIGASRVVIGAHWTSDVVAAWCIVGPWMLLLARELGPNGPWARGPHVDPVGSPTPSAARPEPTAADAGPSPAVVTRS
jgi:membrane-associated phospholipid phosphatase